jgi:hypothetical protein
MNWLRNRSRDGASGVDPCIREREPQLNPGTGSPAGHGSEWTHFMPRNPERRSSGLASPPPTGVAAGRVEIGHPIRELERLNVLIGRWITEGHTVAAPDAPSVPIVASDVYQWVAGGHFVVHPAYGRLGTSGGGGVEIIGYDAATRQFRTWFFDSQGNVITEALINEGDTWTWVGERVRCTGVLTDGGKILTARHERSDDGVTWVPSMNVTLRKVE